MWLKLKISTDLLSDASQAQAAIIREAATTSNASLLARGEVIRNARARAHNAQPPHVQPRLNSDDDAALDPVDRMLDRPGTPRSQSSLASSLFSPVASSSLFSPGNAPNRSTTAQTVRNLLHTASLPMGTSEIEQIIQSMQRVSAAQPGTPASAPLMIRKQERLAELSDFLADGIINETEYRDARMAILSAL